MKILNVLKKCECWWCKRGRGEHKPTEEFLEKLAARMTK